MGDGNDEMDTLLRGFKTSTTVQDVGWGYEDLILGHLASTLFALPYAQSRG